MTEYLASTKKRNQEEARRVLREHYPFKCCVVCGLQIDTCLTAAHLDQNPANNAPDNLAWLCQTHHWMFDAALYPIEAIKLLRAHWQVTEGVPNHSARMKGAGPKAAKTRTQRAAARERADTSQVNLYDFLIKRDPRPAGEGA
jgi:hypothetical protein